MLRGRLDISEPVPIIGDGGFSHPDIGDGRLIPVLIIDCSKHRQLYELILLHENTPPGDVNVTWGRKRFDKKYVYLSLEFLQPVRTKAVFCFALDKQSSIVDGIIHSRGVYLQPAESGRSVSQGIDKPKIIVEIPISATFSEWAELHRGVVVRSYRKAGASRKEANELAKEHVARLGELWKRWHKK